MRCPDPWWEVRRGWLVRRLEPDCSRIDIDELVHHRDLAELLHAMGGETANIHLGTPGKIRKRLRASVADLRPGWLLEAARAMHKACIKDWRDYKRMGSPRSRSL